MRRFLNKLPRLWGRARFQSELDEEMAFHRAQAEKEFMAEGKTAEEARYAAMRQFGNATRLREESQQVVEFRLETVVQDVRFALRQMRKNPGFAVTAVLILALGMGVSVAIFGFVDAALVRPLPFARPDRLVAVDERGAMYPRSNLSRADYEDWKRLNHSFESLEVYSGTGFLLRMGAGTEPVTGARVSDGFFTTLGIKPVLGRLFSAWGRPAAWREDCDAELWNLADAVWGAAGCNWAVGDAERGELHDCGGVAAGGSVFAAREQGDVGAAAG